MAVSASLLQRCKADDPPAWIELVRTCSPRVHRWSMLLGLRAIEAEDVAQEVLSIMARRIHRCDSERVLLSWLYQITRRVVANARRSHWLRRILPIGDGGGPSFEKEASGDAVELDLAVRSCLRALPLRQAEVLVLAEIEGFTRREISELLGLPTGTVASRLRLARRAFERRWDGPGAAIPGLERPVLAWEKPS